MFAGRYPGPGSEESALLAISLLRGRQVSLPCRGFLRLPLLAIEVDERLYCHPPGRRSRWQRLRGSPQQLRLGLVEATLGDEDAAEPGSRDAMVQRVGGEALVDRQGLARR